MEDRFLDTEQSVSRLVTEYNKHGNLFIGFDFDNTVFDFHKRGDTFPSMENLLKFLKDKGFVIVIFTGNEGIDLANAIKYCKDRGFEPDYVNESPITKPGVRKPMLSILLDDRCGLRESYEIVVKTLWKIGFDYDDGKLFKVYDCPNISERLNKHIENESKKS